MFVLRETFRYLRHTWASWLIQALALGVALGVSGLFVLLAWKAHEAMADLRANLAIEAFFDPDVASQDASTIVDENIRSLSGVTRIVFISKEQALEDYAKMSGEDVGQVLGMNPLPASVKVYLSNPTSNNANKVEALLRKIPRIQEVKSNAPLIGIMESRSLALDHIAIILCSLLILSAFFHALTATRHGFEVRRATMHTLTRMGATRFMIIAPMVFYNAFAGMLSGVIGMGILYLIHSQVLLSMNEGLATTLNLHEEIGVCAMLIISGLVVSLLAALFNLARAVSLEA